MNAQETMPEIATQFLLLFCFEHSDTNWQEMSTEVEVQDCH
jgi:hypothetical protein